MNTTSKSKNTNTHSIILTTGMFDLLKDQIRRKRLSSFNEDKLVDELKTAKQVLRNQLPENVVDVNTNVHLRDLQSDEILIYNFVADDRARRKNRTESILSSIGIALIGYTEGSEISWEMTGGIRRYRIEKVSAL